MLRDYLSHLVSQSRLTPAQAEAVFRESQARSEASGAVLVERGYLSLMELPAGLQPPTPPPEPTPDSLFLSDAPRPSGRIPSSQSVEVLRPEIQQALNDPHAPRLGRYLLLGELGRGGMGVVHRAFDPELRREVAIKQLIPREGETGEALERRLRRFQFEGRAAAKLQHPLIVGVLEVGSEQGKPYLVMEYVEGTDLHTLLGREDPPLRRRVEFVRDMAEALGHAHRHGIVHRDVKPGNVLVDTSGRARLTDFGLARDTAVTSGLSHTGQIMGTPQFLSPEQAAGQVDETAPATDVFSLGGVLYLALTGEQPFPGENLIELLGMITTSDPVRPSKLNPTINRDLETIVLKCLEKDQAKRYPDGAAVAQELERFLAGEAIEARPLSGWERVLRAARRNKALSAISLVSSVALVFGGVYSIWAIRVERDLAEAERTRAVASQREAEAAQAESEAARKAAIESRLEAEARRQEAASAAARAERESAAKDGLLAQALSEKGSRLLAQRRFAPAAALFAQSLTLEESVGARSGLFRAFQSTRRRVWRDGDAPYTSLALLGERFLAADERGFVQAFDQEQHTDLGGHQPHYTERKTNELPPREPPCAVLDLDAGAGVVVAALANGKIAIWGEEDLARPTLVEGCASGAVVALDLAPGGAQIAAVSEDQALTVYDAQGKPKTRVALGFRPLSVAWNANRTWIAVGGAGSLTLVAPDGSARLSAPAGEERWYRGVAFLGEELYTCDLEGELRAWTRGADALQLASRVDTGGPTHALATWTPGGLVAIGTASGRLRCRDVKAERWIYDTLGEDSPLCALRFTDAGVLVAANRAGRLQRHEPTQGRELLSYMARRCPGRVAAFSLGAQSTTSFFTGDDFGRLWFMDPIRQRRLVISAAARPIADVAVAADGAQVVVSSYDRKVTVHEFKNKTKYELRGTEGAASAKLAFGPGRRLAAGVGAKVLLYDLPNPGPVRVFDAPGTVDAIALDAAGRVAVSGASFVVLFDPEGRELKRLRLSDKSPALAFEPGRGRLAMALADQILLWDPQSGAQAVCRGHEARVTSLAFSRDGQLLVSGGQDGWTCVWTPRVASLLCVLEGHEDNVTGVGIDALGRYVLSVGQDGSVRSWEIRPHPARRDLAMNGWSLRFSREGLLYGGGAEAAKGLEVFDTRNDQATAYSLGSAAVRDLELSPQEDLIAFTLHRASWVGILERSSGRVVRRIEPGGKLYGFSFVGEQLVTSSDLKLKVWDPRTGGQVGGWDLDPADQLAMTLAGSPDGSWIAAGTARGVQLFSSGGLSGAHCPIATGHMVTGLRFSPDGKRLAVGTQGIRQAFGRSGNSSQPSGLGGGVFGEARLFELETQRVTVLRRIEGLSMAVEFSPDGRYLAETCGGVVLWDLKRGTRWLNAIDDDERGRTGVAFSVDGRLLATTDRARTTVIWELPELGVYDAPARAVARVAGRTGYRVIGLDPVLPTHETDVAIRARLAALGR